MVLPIPFLSIAVGTLGFIVDIIRKEATANDLIVNVLSKAADLVWEIAAVIREVTDTQLIDELQTSMAPLLEYVISNIFQSYDVDLI